jgi:nicotinamidase-related amidase
VLATAIRANVLDYASVCIEDCVDTMDGPVLHEAALTCMRAAFCWVMTGQDALDLFPG